MIIDQKFDLRDLNDFLATMWGGRRIKAKPFLYPVNFGELSSGITSEQTLTIAGDSDFVFLSSYIAARNAGNDVPFPTVNFRLLITDTGTNEKYMSDSAFTSNYCNDIGNPYASLRFISLPIPRRIPRQTTLSFSLTNNNGPDARSVSLTLEGLRVWEYSQ